MKDTYWQVHVRMKDGSIRAYQAVKLDYPTWEEALNACSAQDNVSSGMMRVK